MFTLIKGGSLYGPEKLGVKDILIVGKTIAKIADQVDLPKEFNPRLISALKMITSNPAKRAGIYQHKGSIEERKDADLLILGDDLRIETVIAKGQVMIQNGEVVVKGTFEE